MNATRGNPVKCLLKGSCKAEFKLNIQTHEWKRYANCRIEETDDALLLTREPTMPAPPAAPVSPNGP